MRMVMFMKRCGFGCCLGENSEKVRVFGGFSFKRIRTYHLHESKSEAPELTLEGRRFDSFFSFAALGHFPSLHDTTSKQHFALNLIKPACPPK